MSWKNYTTSKEFILLGLSNISSVQKMLFVVFLVIYLSTLLANSLVILAIVMDNRLHTPMYFFLVNLSVADICLSSSGIPRLLRDLLSTNKTISLGECVAQMYIALSLGMTETLVLVAMAYDRYVAICYPLHYTTIIDTTKCIMIATGAWVCGLLLSFVVVALTWSVDFCGPNEIDHFSCEAPDVLTLGCGNVSAVESVIFAFGVMVLIIPVSFLIITYFKIIRAIFKIRTSEGQKKAFSTCGSHIVVVILFFGSAMATYLKPRSKSLPDTDKLFAVFYMIVTPLLNPLVYTLRNKEVKSALKLCWLKHQMMEHIPVQHPLRP